MSDETTVQIVLRWKEENEQVVALVQAQLAAVGTQAAATNTGLLAMAQSAWAGAGGWGQIAIAVAAAAVVFAPIGALILSAAVALVSFTVGAAGFLAVAGLVVGAFAAIGAGVLLLGGGGGIGAAAALATTTTQLAAAQQAVQDFNALHTGDLTLAQKQQLEDLTLRQTQAQQKYSEALAASQGPTGVLIAQLTQMKDTLAAQAAPLAALITQWVGGAVPAVTLLGQSLMTWFGDRLPGVLTAMGKVIQDLSPSFTTFFNFLGSVMDHVGPQLSAMGEAMIRLGLGAVTGLIANLVRLSDWFQKELPTLGPIVQQIFDWFGRSVQGLADTWAKLTDWVIANWPATVADAKKQIDILSGAFKDLADPKGHMNNALQGFIDTGTALKTISDNIAPLLGDLGRLSSALQPIADVLDHIGRAVNNNGLWFHNLITGTGLSGNQANWGGSGSTNGAYSGSQTAGSQTDMSTTNSLLGGILQHIATLAGQPTLSATAAALRNG
jgi:uncharacterized membrane protein